MNGDDHMRPAAGGVHAGWSCGPYSGALLHEPLNLSITVTRHQFQTIHIEALLLVFSYFESTILFGFRQQIYYLEGQMKFILKWEKDRLPFQWRREFLKCKDVFVREWGWLNGITEKCKTCLNIFNGFKAHIFPSVGCAWLCSNIQVSIPNLVILDILEFQPSLILPVGILRLSKDTV